MRRQPVETLAILVDLDPDRRPVGLEELIADQQSRSAVVEAWTLATNRFPVMVPGGCAPTIVSIPPLPAGICHRSTATVQSGSVPEG